MSDNVERRYLEQKDVEHILRDVGNNEFVIVSQSRTTDKESFEFWSALIPNEEVEQALRAEGWDLSLREGYPGCNGSEPNRTVYQRFGQSDGIEPLVFRRSFSDIKPGYVEISQEFCHFHNLYQERKSNKFIKIMSDGTEQDVVVVSSDDTVTIRLKELRQFLAIKEMHLAIYVHSGRWSRQSLEDLAMSSIHGIEHDELVTFFRLVQNNPLENYRSSSLLLGKKLIPPFAREKCGIWPFPKESHESVKFIVRSKNGEDIEACCDSFEALPGDSTPGSIQYLTPVFFRQEVLDKYRDEPSKFHIRDGDFSCGNKWGMSIDNNRGDGFISAYLGDLGRDLPHSEQLRWRQFNVAPKGRLSTVAIARDFDCEFAAPSAPDNVFIWKFEYLRKKWSNHFGWELFKSLSKEDEHHFRTFHLPGDNQLKFERQVVTLSLILIESINEGEIKNYIKVDSKDKGISKLEKFLVSQNLQNYAHHIKFLRELYSLRLGSGPHRKGEAYKDAAKYFQLNETTFDRAFKSILQKAVELLDYLDSCVDEIAGQRPVSAALAIKADVGMGESK
jgi:hypothetical protein